MKFELLGKKVDGLEANGQCGFRMKANDTSRGGEYKLSARVGPNVIYNGMVDVKIVRSNGAGSNNNEVLQKKQVFIFYLNKKKWYFSWKIKL